MGTRADGSTGDKVLHHIWHFFCYMIPWRSFIFIFVFLLLIYIDYLAVQGFIFQSNVVFREAVIISLTTGIIGSFLFLILTFTLKPSIAVSPFILETISMAYPDTPVWTIKIINCNWLFNITDVNVTLYEFEEMDWDGLKEKKNFRRTSLEIKQSYFSYISPRLHRKGGKYAAHCYVIGCYEDLNKILSGKNSLELEIVAKHELSGFGIVKKKRFITNQNVVHKGKFAHGDNFLILPNVEKKSTI